MATGQMKLSPEGEQFIKVAEEAGGKPRLTAYNDGTGTWTIGWGCTHGVKRGMTCTVKEAQQMFDAEIGDIEDGLRKWIKVEVSQGLWDALVSFGFNNGWGKCPSLKAAVNSGDMAKVRRAFMLYVNAYNQKKGKTEPWPGLVKRRTDELNHWAKMDAADAGARGDAWAPAEEPPKKTATQVMKESKHLPATLNAILALIVAVIVTIWHGIVAVADWLGQAIGVLPQVADHVTTSTAAMQTLVAAFNIPWPMMVGTGFAIACGTYALVRELRKRMGEPA